MSVVPRPSGLALTVACSASLTLQTLVPAAPQTEEEAEGTAAHWVALRYAAGYGRELPIGAKFLSQNQEWTVDADMMTGAVTYANACGNPHPDLRLEDPVWIPQAHPTLAGTPDAWRYFPDALQAWENVPEPFSTNPEFVPGHAKLVRVCDYKYGHRFVEVYGNYQLVSYFFGVAQRLQLDIYDPNLWVEFIVVQPRSYHRDGPVRIWRVKAVLLFAVLQTIKKACEEALTQPVARTNEHCIDCKARHVCTVLQRSVYSIIDYSGSPEITQMPNNAVGQELAMIDEAIKRLKARRTGLAVHAESLLRSGQPVAHYHMERGESRLVYRDDVTLDELVSFGNLVKIDLRKPQKLKDSIVTPTQAIALGIDRGLMNVYAHRPPAALELTRDDSTTIRKVFNK